MGGCQIHFTVSSVPSAPCRDTPVALLTLGTLTAPPPGGHRLHGLQRGPPEQLLPALHQPLPAQRVPQGTGGCGRDLPGLRQVGGSGRSPGATHTLVMSTLGGDLLVTGTQCWHRGSSQPFPCSDKKFSALGFGARIPPKYEVRGSQGPVGPGDVLVPLGTLGCGTGGARQMPGAVVGGAPAAPSSSSLPPGLPRLRHQLQPRQ